MTEKELEAHREFLQGVVNSLGRDDIGIGEVTEAGGMLIFALTRGDRRYRAELPVGLVADRERAKTAMMEVLPKLTKAVEREHIEAAQKAD